MSLRACAPVRASAEGLQPWQRSKLQQAASQGRRRVQVGEWRSLKEGQQGRGQRLPPKVGSTC